MANHKLIFREGATAGVLGAAGVALWFLGVDMLNGRPLDTPATLGEAMMGVLGHGIQNGVLFNSAAYTVFHFGAFIVLGFVLSELLEVSRRVPQVLAGMLLCFVVFEVGFYFLTALMAAPAILGKIGWVQIGAGNLVAAVLMGGYLWRKHPEAVGELSHALDGSV